MVTVFFQNINSRNGVLIRTLKYIEQIMLIIC